MATKKKTSATERTAARWAEHVARKSKSKPIKVERTLYKEVRSLAEGALKFSPATQHLLVQTRGAAIEAADARGELDHAVYLEDLEDALDALRDAGKLLAKLATEARAAVRKETH